MIALVVAISLSNYLQGQAATALVERTMSERVAELRASQQATAAAYQIKIDVIQVQQWLTDISATRGLDGLNDGFDEAAGYADRLPGDLEAARTAARALGDTQLLDALADVESRFPPFYEAGRRMAQAYIDEGPAAGNLMMPEFDAVAASMGEAIDAMTREIDRISAVSSDAARADSASVIAEERFRMWLDVVSHGVLILATIGLILFVMKKFGLLNRIAATAAEIARGKLDTQPLGESSWTEISALRDAIEIFRETSGVQTAVLAAVDSNRTAMLLIDRDGEAIHCNGAFDDLWSKVGGALNDLTDKSRKETPDGGAVKARNYARLLRAVETAEKAGAGVRTKRNGEVALDLQHNGLVIEVKHAPIVNQHGEEVGAAIELGDVTAVRKLEADLIDVINAVENGAFDKRVSFIDGLGFTSIAANGLNNLMDAMSRFMIELDGSLSSLAEGDLTRPIDGAFKGDFQAAKERFNTSLQSLSHTLAEVGGAVERVRGEADPIAAGSRDLASRAESQAATLQETVATMDQVGSTIKQTADSAERAVDMSARASRLAESGGSIVSETISAMGRIEESSQEIGDIISVIEGIAFQTNLLALNAAVEAARAGDGGKGFAVVASEVRSLAQRSSEAASDIKGLIENSAGQVKEGVTLVNRTGESLAEIVQEIRAVAGTISEISSAMREQSSGVSEINASFANLDEMTQRNASLAEQSASSANKLHDAASELGRLIAAFKTAKDAAATRAWAKAS